MEVMCRLGLVDRQGIQVLEEGLTERRLIVRGLHRRGTFLDEENVAMYRS